MLTGFAILLYQLLCLPSWWKLYFSANVAENSRIVVNRRSIWWSLFPIISYELVYPDVTWPEMWCPRKRQIGAHNFLAIKKKVKKYTRMVQIWLRLLLRENLNNQVISYIFYIYKWSSKQPVGHEFLYLSAF